MEEPESKTLLDLIKEFIDKVLQAKSREDTLKFLHDHDLNMYDDIIKLYDLVDSARDWKEFDPQKRTNTFELAWGDPKLPALDITSETLCDIIMPFITMLTQIQTIIDQLSGGGYRTMKIQSIKYLPTIEISVDGIAEALSVVNKLVLPWRGYHQKRLDVLRDKEERLLKARQEMIDLNNKVESARNNARLRELDKNISALRKGIAAQNQAIEKELIKKSHSIVLDQLPNATGISEEDRMVYVIWLLKPLRMIAESPLKLTLVELNDAVVL